jgi:LAO/AO transport system ATPase
MNRPVRVLIAKIGLDGHDRGAKLIVRNLRDAGMEVIYTGLWQTPASTVHAALQEDVDVLGASLLSAAHMTIMPELRRLCSEVGLEDLPIVVGGIIPEDDHQPLLDAGIDGVFNPGTHMKTVIDSVQTLAERRRKQRDAASTAPDLRSSSDLARAITYVVEGQGGRLGELPSPEGRSVTLGITGSPGVGKSTFIGKLAANLRARGRRVAVIAVDPTSPITGGSVLGDRLRIQGDEPDKDLFIRSLSSSGQAGGLAPRCEEVARVLLAAGFEILLVETVGAGQNDTAVRQLASEVLLLLMPGAGDAVQFAKAGVYEIATGFVVNKADLPGTDATVRQLRETLDDQRPVWTVSSLRNEGLDPLCDWVEQKLET